MMILGYLIEASDTRNDRCLEPKKKKVPSLALDGASPVTVILPLFNSNLYAISTQTTGFFHLRRWLSFFFVVVDHGRP